MSNYFIWILFCVVITCTFSKQDKNDIIKLNVNKELNIIEDTMRLLEEGRSQLNFSENLANSFIVGTTGTGKTTVALILTGDNSKLISVDIGGERPIGMYLIEDETGLIGDEAVVSKTIIPYLFVDYDHDEAVFYDCPGFDDTRNTSVDMTSSFFIKDVIDHANYTKFIFVINHDTVTSSGDRNAFLKLTEHIDRFMKEIKKYAPGIGAIISKVEKPTTPDQNIIYGIVYFLEQTLGVLERDPNPKPHYPTAIEFLKILLQSEDGEIYPRLSLSRGPDRAGPLSEIEIIQKGKIKMYDMIYKELKFVEKIDEDFGYTISDQSQNDVYILAEGLNKEIASIMLQINKEIEQYFNVEENDLSQDMYVLENKFDSSANILNEFGKNPEKLDTTTKFIIHLNETLAKLQVSISENVTIDLLNKLDFFDFLQNVSHSELNIDAIAWIHSLAECKLLVNDMNQFYKFLPKLNSEFSMYKYQSDTSKYNVADLNHWGQIGKPQGIQITTDNWELFLEKTEFIYMKNVELNDVKLNRLNTILEWTLKYKIITKCEGEKLSLSGEYIKTSDAVDAECFKSVKVISIMAVNSVFFNADLNKTSSRAEVSIMGQKWQVESSRKILLSGTDGISNTQPGKNGMNYNENGEPGKPGGNGGVGGQFFGLSNVFENEQFLSINADGGRGGNGQTGGNGFSVVNQMVMPSDEIGNLDCESRIPVRASDSRKLYKQTATDYKWSGTHPHYTDYYYYWYDVYGDCGGSGANGGAAGNGGDNGEIELIPLNRKPNIQISSKKGDNGICGEGGKEGKNAKVLNTKCTAKIVKTCTLWCAVHSRTHKFTENKYEDKYFEYCRTLSNGQRCGNKMDDVQSIQNRNNQKINSKTEISAYKAFIRSNVNVGLRKATLESFIALLDSKTKSYFK